MMIGRYSKQELPRVVHVSVARYSRVLPQPGEELEFLVGIHEEGTGVTWQQNVTVDAATEAFLAEATHQLHLWSLNLALTPKKADALLKELGGRLYQAFLGPTAEPVLSAITPTAVLWNVDETILNLPWELLATPKGVLTQGTPFGRLVTTRQVLRPGRNPVQEDTVARILAVANPTLDLAATKKGIQALRDLEADYGEFSVEVTVLAEQEATRARFAELLEEGKYDLVHFAGHAFLRPDEPGSSALRFADGELTADQVLELRWEQPPYWVFNSACESGRAVAGQRLVSGESHSNGLAAAFLAGGVAGYAGYFWPVTDAGAEIFARTFYRTLFMRENVGLAFLDARQAALSELGEVGDLTGYSAVLYGDAASAHRRDLAMAV